MDKYVLFFQVSDEESLEDVYYSEDDGENNMENGFAKKGATTAPTTAATTKGRRTSEPKCTALWVGNVDPQKVTDKQMSNLFAKCGKVASVRILPHKYCAFVNYVEQNNAMKAMEKLQVCSYNIKFT